VRSFFLNTRETPISNRRTLLRGAGGLRPGPQDHRPLSPGGSASLGQRPLGRLIPALSLRPSYPLYLGLLVGLLGEPRPPLRRHPRPPAPFPGRRLSRRAAAGLRARRRGALRPSRELGDGDDDDDVYAEDHRDAADGTTCALKL
jgi:hypothetical protein